MKIKSMSLLVSAVALLAACAGEKNDNFSGTVLLTRANETGTEMALVDTSAQSEEELQQYVDENDANIQWVSADQFQKDEELDLSSGADATESGYGYNGGNRFGGNNNNCYNSNCNNWRPYQPKHQWKKKWQTPKKHYWGYNKCNYGMIWYGGRCCYPYSRAYNYRWKARWGWNYRPRYNYSSSSYWYVRVYF